MVQVLVGDCQQILKTLPDQSVHTCVTSPPYWGLRDYGHEDQIGLEATPEAYVNRIVEVFREVRRVLRDDGTLWLNLADSYAGAGYSSHEATVGTRKEQGGKQHHTTNSGLKNKDLVGIPWRVAFALQADGWWLRQDIIWHKPNPMPESVTDRCTKAHEYLFLLSKQERYHYDANAIAEPAETYGKDKRSDQGNIRYQGKRTSADNNHSGQQSFVTINETRNKRSVWTISTKGYNGAHFAVMPPELVEPCVKATCPQGGTVLDPFGGSGTTGLVANQLARHAILIELNPKYAKLAKERTAQHNLFS